jgi:uncharacterized protein involved in exopolysaccharide biosynthesis
MTSRMDSRLKSEWLMKTTATKAGEDEITLRDLVNDLLSGRYYILATMVFFAVVGFISGKVTEKQYEAQVVVAPVGAETGRGGGLGALASQYGDLASLAGISSPAASKKTESLAVLQSELLTDAYITNQNLLPVLQRDSWVTRIRRSMGRTIKPLTLWQGNQVFKQRVRSVRDDKVTGMVFLKITWRDPLVAAKWANDLIKLTNTFLRDKAIREAERNIRYLSEQAANTNIIEARQAIFSLLKDEINNEMLAKGREEYALKVIDPATAPEKSSSFGSTTLSILGLMIGFAFSILAILTLRILRNAL